MEMEIEAAADHGVNVFIYDWYWYDGRPFLENCLNDGFLKAKNRDRMKFYLMWANHDANSLWDKHLSQKQGTVIWKGAVGREEFRRVIDSYFRQPNYYRIDGTPVFQIYDLSNLAEGLSGLRRLHRPSAGAQSLRGRPPGPAAPDHGQQLERVDRDQLPGAGRSVRIRVSGNHTGSVRIAKRGRPFLGPPLALSFCLTDRCL